jgi:hypothetical protein
MGDADARDDRCGQADSDVVSGTGSGPQVVRQRGRIWAQACSIADIHFMYVDSSDFAVPKARAAIHANHRLASDRSLIEQQVPLPTPPPLKSSKLLPQASHKPPLHPPLSCSRSSTSLNTRGKTTKRRRPKSSKFHTARMEPIAPYSRRSGIDPSCTRDSAPNVSMRLWRRIGQR